MLPRLLLVDDDASLLKATQKGLSAEFEVLTATSGTSATALIVAGPPFEVIISDFDMPGLDGVAFLGRAKQIAPDSTRLLLTGHGNLQVATDAINRGQIFRFLTKPVDLTILLSSCRDATKQFRLVTAEKVLLEETLHGCTKTLTEILSLANPTAFGRGSRLQFGAQELCKRLTLADRWQIEIAAMMSQIGAIGLSPNVVDRLYDGHPLSTEEQEIAAKIPSLASTLR